jgi:hypothetical protein
MHELYFAVDQLFVLMPAGQAFKDSGVFFLRQAYERHIIIATITYT